MSDPPEIEIPELGGTLVLRVMPDDNSCLFRSISTAAMSGIDVMTELRSVVAQTIQSHPDKYTTAVLDNKSPNDYCRWIQTENAWGGQIELDILSQHFGIEICSIDVKSLRVIDITKLLRTDASWYIRASITIRLHSVRHIYRQMKTTRSSNPATRISYYLSPYNYAKS